MTDGSQREGEHSRGWLVGLVPGLPQIMDGRRLQGALWLTLALVLLGVLVGARRRIVRTPTAGDLDDWVALLTLVTALVVTWTVSLRSATGPSRSRGAGLQVAWREFRRNRLASGGLYLVLFLYLVALLTPYLAPYDPIAQVDVAATRYLPPSLSHLMGTDRFGRDILSRVLFGARISLSIGLLAVAIAVTLGTVVGAVAGYIGGRTDTILMRLVDMLISFPRLVLVITIVALFEPSIFLVTAVLGLTLWPSTARIVRGESLSLREREFVQAARALGLSERRIILRHVVPNVLAPVIVAATLGIGNTILLEAGLSFLGIGVQPPTASWGNMVAMGRDSLIDAWWVATFPGLAIVLAVVAFNLVGDGLRDAIDPRLRV